MAKNPRTRLALHRETLRNLDGAALAKIRGATLYTGGGFDLTTSIQIDTTIIFQSNNIGCRPTSIGGTCGF